MKKVRFFLRKAKVSYLWVAGTKDYFFPLIHLRAGEKIFFGKKSFKVSFFNLFDRLLKLCDYYYDSLQRYLCCGSQFYKILYIVRCSLPRGISMQKLCLLCAVKNCGYLLGWYVKSDVNPRHDNANGIF